MGLAALLLPVLALPPAVRAQDLPCGSQDAWLRLAAPVPSPTALAVDPADPQVALVADARRVAATADGGCTWAVVVDLGDAPAAGEVAVQVDRVAAVDVTAGVAAVALTRGAGVGGLPADLEAGAETTTVLRADDPADPGSYTPLLGPATPPDGPEATAALTGRPLAVAVAPQGVAVVVEQQGGRTAVLVRPTPDGPWRTWAALDAAPPAGLLRLPEAAVTGLAWGPQPTDPLYGWGRAGLLAVTADGAIGVGPAVGPVTALAAEPGRLVVAEQRPVVHTSTDGGASWTSEPGPDAAASPTDLSADAGALASVLAGVRDSRVRLRLPGGPWADITDPTRPLLTTVAIAGGARRPVVWAAGPGGVHRIALRGDVTTLDVPQDDPLADVLLGLEQVTPVPSAPGTVVVDPASVSVDVGERRRVSVRVDLPPRPGPVDVGFVVDGTGSMGPFLRPLRDRFADVVRAFAARGVDAHYGVAVYRVHPTALEPSGDIYTRRADIGPPGPDLAAGLRGLDIPAQGDGGRQDAPGGNLPTSAIEALHQAVTGAGYDVPPAAAIPPGQGFTFRPGTARLLLNATDVAFERGRPGATMESAIAAMTARGVQQAGIFVANGNANAVGHVDLVTVAAGTGALAAAPIDCDGDGRDDIVAGEPVVCGRPDVTAPTGQEIPQGRLPEAIVDLALATPELRGVRVDAAPTAGLRADPGAPVDVDVRQPSVAVVEVTITCPPAPTSGSVQLTAVLGDGALPAEVLGTAVLPVACTATTLPPGAGPAPGPVVPADPVTAPAAQPAEPPAPASPVQQPGIAVAPPGPPPAPITVPAPAPAPGAAGAASTGTAGAAAPSASASTSTSTAVAAPPAASTTTGVTGQGASATGAAPADRVRGSRARVRSATVDGRRLPAVGLPPARGASSSSAVPVAGGVVVLGIAIASRRHGNTSGLRPARGLPRTARRTERD